MTNVRTLLAALTLCLSRLAFSQNAAEEEVKKCAPPVPGTYAGSCEALKVKDVAESKHVGDVWINCVTLSGEHGSGGYGMAMFSAQDVRTYWNDEMDAYLATLEQLLPPEAFKKLKAEHAKWEEAFPAAEERAYKAAYKEYGEGSAASYVGELKTLEIVRQRALTLGCRIESRRK